jgi:cell division septation protein DedD
MFADSPGLHGIEHPVYDIWLTACKGDGPLIKEAPEVVEAPPDDSDAAEAPATASAPANASPTPKPTRTRRPRPKPTAAGLEPPTDIGRTPSRQFFPDSAAPGAPMHIGR